MSADSVTVEEPVAVPLDPAMKLVTRLNFYFGLRVGQDRRQFLEECKSLTPEDRAWFAAAFNEMGMPTSA
ncbi:MAG: hypothetical protein KJZ69_12875 [Phycisphaerales bacterium]|nr:hypothetical protein [Phycisphaerales bacterium]